MSGAGDRIDKQATARRRYYHPTQKDYATLLQTSEETDGERTLIEVEVAPGGGELCHSSLESSSVLALGRPSGLVPDIAGPRVYEMRELLRSYLRASHRHRLIMPVRRPAQFGPAPTSPPNRP